MECIQWSLKEDEEPVEQSLKIHKMSILENSPYVSVCKEYRVYMGEMGRLGLMSKVLIVGKW